MRIAIDARSAEANQATGVENYSRLLIENLGKIDKDDKFFILKKNKLPAILWFNLYLPWQLIKNKIDAFHSPITRFPLWLPKRVKKVATVHDLTWEHYPELYSEKELKIIKNKVIKDIKRADRILAVSETTKNDLVKFYNIDERKITATPLAFKKKGFEVKDINKKYQIDFNYLLFVGTLYPRKNIKIVLEALKNIPDLHLILIGKEGFEKDEIMKNASNRVHHLGYIPDEELPAFYEQSTAFIFPSLYEGFGLPLLEAFHYQTPVIASDIEIFKEVGGEACLFFNPKDSSDLEKRIKEVKNVREDLISQGKKQLENFSIENLIKKTIKGYQE